MTQILRVTRRSVLAAAVATSVDVTAAEPLDLVISNGGFTVRRGVNDIWTVPAAAVERALGEGAALEVVGGEARKSLSVSGRLLNRPTLLRLVFELRRASWIVQATLTVGSGPVIAFPPIDAPSTTDGPLEFRRALTAGMARPLAAVFPSEVALAGARLSIGRNLSVHFDLPQAEGIWPGVPRATRWLLLPGVTGDGGITTLARSDLAVPEGFAVDVGRRAERAVRLTGRATAIRAVRSPNLRAAVAVDGYELKLSVGQFTLRLADAGEGREQACFGLDDAGQRAAEVVLRVAPVDQRVETPAGTFEVTGSADGPPDVHLQARSGRLSKFNVSAVLTHYDIRLPVGGNAQGYADLARLDFANGPRVAFWLGQGPGADGVGIVRLAGGGPAAELSLDRARLRVRREMDLLSLVFGFDGVTLVVRDTGAALRLPGGVGACPAASARAPLLRVEFPPQHVLEHAFARRRPQVPGPDLRTKRPAMGGPSEAERARDADSRKALDAELTQGKRYPDRFEPFLASYRERLKALLHLKNTEGHPDHFWFGTDFAFTPHARRAARESVALPEPALADLALGVPRIVVTDLLALHPPKDAPGAAALLQALLLEAERRDDDHAIVQQAWRRRQTPGMPERFYDKAAWGIPPGPPRALLPDRAATPWEAEFGDTAVSRAIRAMWAMVPDFQDRKASAAVAGALRDAYREAFPWCAPEAGPDGCAQRSPAGASTAVEARAAGVTQLVFEWPCGATAPSERPYSLSELLDWDNLELRVTRRAQRFEPRSAVELAAALRHQGISAGDDAKARLAHVAAAAERNGEPPEVEDWASAEPADWRAFPRHTRITLPARLQLSPAGDARFRVTSPPSGRDRVQLWRAQLRERPGQAPTLRAIGSPDFVAAALGAGAPTPVRGPGESWTSEGGRRFRGSLDAYDRHQIVGLSSVHGLPVIPRRGPDGKLHLSQVAPPPAYRLAELRPDDQREQALYVPQALSARHLSLSAMGATLELDARFTPPAALRTALGQNLFEAFSVERWRSSIVLGREVVTEVLYKGFLYPLGHKATLVKVTERLFEPAPVGVPGGPVAFLSQHLFIQVASATKTYQALGQPFEGRAWPARSVEIVTARTPDLVEPFLPPSGEDGAYVETARGTLRRKGGVGLVFWPRTALGRDNDVRFRLRIDGASDVLDLPLLFVDNAAAHEPIEMRRVQDYYNGIRGKAVRNDDAGKAVGDDDAGKAVRDDDARRRLEHRGAARRYAAERRPGDTTFETSAWILRADSRAPMRDDEKPSQNEAAILTEYAMDSALESDDQPPFYPRLHEAYIRHGPAARFAGSEPGELTVRYAAGYLSTRFRSQSEEEARRGDGLANDTFMRVTAPLDASITFGSAGDRSGAIGRPEQPIRSLARIGPVGGSESASSPGISKNFFGPGAKLLGLIDFNRLLEKVADTAAAPLLREVTEFTCSEGVQDEFGTLGNALQTLHAAISGNSVARTVYRTLLDVVGNARDKVRAVTSCTAGDAPGLVSAVTEAALALRTLSAELERLAATPLAPLTEYAREILEGVRREISSMLEAISGGLLSATGIQEAVGRAMAGARDLLLPVRENWLRAAFLASEAERALLDAAQGKILAALDDAFAKGLEGPPRTLADLRQRVAQGFRERVRTLASGEGGEAQAVLERFADASRETIAAARIPPVVAELYALGASLAHGNVKEVGRLLAGEASRQLAEWAGGIAPAACEKATAVLAPLRVFLDRPIGDLGVCGIADAACPAQGTGWCARLWAATCTLGVEVTLASDRLVVALRDLDEAKRGLANAVPGDLNCVPGLPVAEWERAVAAWSEAGEQARDWLDALAMRAQALQAEAESAARDAGIERIDDAVAVAREMLTALRLPDTVGTIQTALEGVLDADDANTAVGPLRAAQSALAKAVQALPASPTDAAASLRKATEELKDFPGHISRIATTVLERLFLVHVAPAAKSWLDAAARPLLEGAAKAYGAFADARDGLVTRLAEADASLGASGPARLACAVFLDLPEASACGAGAIDGLRVEARRLEEASKEGEPSTAILALLRDWEGRSAAPHRLLDAVLRNLAGAAVAQIVQLLDLGDLRKQIEERLAKLVPSRVTRSYEYKLKLDSEYRLNPIVFRPSDDRLLSLTATAQAAVRGNGADTSLTVDASLAPFTIEVPDYLTLHFKKFTFAAGTGRSPHFDAPFDKVVPSAKLIFLAGLAAYLGYKSGGVGAKRNGPYVEPRPSGAGLRAGFRLAVPSMSIGTVGFVNIAFDGHVELPFTSEDGVARIALSSRAAPFAIVAAPYGGGGFVYLEADATKVRRLDVSLEFGGAAVVSYGPLEGVGRIMTGLYVTQTGDSVINLFGTFTAGFNGSIAGFGVASAFYLRMTHGDGGMAGEAMLEYSFSLGITDITFRVNVWRNEGESLGGKSSQEGRRHAAHHDGMPRVMLALSGDPPVPGEGRTNVPSPLEDWSKHRGLYDTSLRMPRRSAA